MSRIVNIVEVPTQHGVEYLVYYDDGSVQVHKDYPIAE